jgi:glycine hydroxymethyltransferase|tara:strand:+ start:4968 stop:6305 length:1338 start_codon:yes stop_codon:yes gene_type:complete
MSFNNLKTNLKEFDNEIYSFIEEEYTRQKNSIELIASENITSKPVLECLGSVLTNKYSEGYPNKRYYGGNQVIDKIEDLCKTRALDAFNLDNNIWSVNVQPYSGSPANFALYTAILNPHDRLMGLNLPSGGHLTHGFYTKNKSISATSKYFESLSYDINDKGYINYDELEQLATKFCPKLIIAGYSAYSRDLDYKRFREIADINGSFLTCDMAHFNGFVATGLLNNPFEYCDFVTTTTHKTLGGPRAGMIFCKKEYENKINDAVFPGLQGGPHEHQIGALATQLKYVKTDEYKKYIEQVLTNSRQLAKDLISFDFNILTGGTDNHIILVNLKNKGLSGNKVEKLCEMINVSLNKNAVKGDKSALNPSGIRIGTPSITTRGLKENDMYSIASFINIIVTLGIKIQKISGIKIKDFLIELKKDENIKEINDIKKNVEKFINGFEYYD